MTESNFPQQSHAWSELLSQLETDLVKQKEGANIINHCCLYNIEAEIRSHCTRNRPQKLTVQIDRTGKGWEGKWRDETTCLRSDIRSGGLESGCPEFQPSAPSVEQHCLPFKADTRVSQCEQHKASVAGECVF